MPGFSQGSLSFLAGGKKYSITIPELCHLYGFDSSAEAVTFPSRLSVSTAFWNFIGGHGPYFSRNAAQASIRNPALRIAAKAISLLLFSREDTSKVRVDEMLLLYNAVRDVISMESGLSCGMVLDVNMGAVLAGVIAEKRTKVGKGRTEKIGSLLTRLFLHLGVDLSNAACNEDIRLMDLNFLITCGIMADAIVYRFTSRDDRVLVYRLPQPSLTELQNAANIGFTPGTAYLCSESGEPIFPERTPARATTPDPDTHLRAEEIEDLEDETVRTQQCHAEWRRPYRSEYLLRDISDAATEAEYRTWVVDSTKKNNGLLYRILHML